MVLVIGAFLGFISVAFGAFAEHGLRENVTDENFRFILTAVKYNQINAVVIISIGLALLGSNKLGNIAALRWSGVLFIIGTILFSFSIYLAVYFNIPSLTKITPVGGTTIMAAWLLLLWSGLVMKKL